MSPKEFFTDIIKPKLAQVWKWLAIILLVVVCLQTCSRCGSKQTTIYTEKQHQVLVDSLNQQIKMAGDSILVLNGKIQTHEETIAGLRTENEHLRDALKQSQSKPVIIYRETKKENQ